MGLHAEAYKRVLGGVGIAIEEREVYANEGRRSREVLESLVKARGLAMSGDELDALNRQKQKIFEAFGPAPLYPGVRELLAHLRGSGLATAMVTGTARVNVARHLGELVPTFSAVVTADDVTHTKPHPEPYLAALRLLGIEASQAVVVENATLGIRSAKAAGIRVVAVASTLAPEALNEADVVVAGIPDVAAALEGLS